MTPDQVLPYVPIVGGALTLAGTALGILYKVYVGGLKKKIGSLEARAEAAEKTVAVQAQQLAEVAKEGEAYRQEATSLAAVKSAHEQLAADHTLSQEELERYRKESAAMGNRVRKALELEGAIWTQPVMAGTCPFRPLADRRTPIVSVVNLKGGVGKTTLTAYLGWALAARGYRVLLVDLDLQGSLSSFFVTNTALRLMEDDGRLLRHYLDRATRGEKAKLIDYAVPVPQLNPQSRLIATTDKLAYSELGQTFQWLLRVGRPSHQWNGRRDARMVLRRALHAKGLANRFDVILLDCPPLVNLCCANALAASDFLLVPVTPNVKAIERVTPLLRRMQEVRAEGVNPALDLLGVVVNRHQQQDGLTPKEGDLLKDLPQHGYDILKQDVHMFDGSIPQRTQFRDTEDAFVPPAHGTPLATVFEALAEEFIKRLPSHCREPQPARTRRKSLRVTGGGE